MECRCWPARCNSVATRTHVASKGSPLPIVNSPCETPGQGINTNLSTIDPLCPYKDAGIIHSYKFLFLLKNLFFYILKQTLQKFSSSFCASRILFINYVDKKHMSHTKQTKSVELKKLVYFMTILPDLIKFLCVFIISVFLRFARKYSNKVF